jgi:hypothetical protein
LWSMLQHGKRDARFGEDGSLMVFGRVTTGLAWSTRDPWVFASVSYDGRVRDPKALLD